VYGPHAGSEAVSRSLSHARLVLANSAGTARRCRDRGASETRIVHLGADVPTVSERQPAREPPTLVTVAHLIARKRHADVIRAFALVREHHPDLRYVIVGDGPERERLTGLAASLGVEGQLDFRGQLPNRIAAEVARRASIFVLPSIDEAFGVAYVEAMAGGVPAIGCIGEDGPQEIADAGGGIALVPPRDPQALADRIRSLLAAPNELQAMGEAARATVRRSFTWERCGQATVAAYRDVLEACA
jgi:glycosyltransferase involved in cell wall biosynthesis